MVIHKQNNVNRGILKFLPALLLFTSVGFFSTYGQITVLNTNINSFNITPKSLCAINIMNNGQLATVTLTARLYNSANEELLSIVTNSFALKNGLNSAGEINPEISSVMYNSVPQARYIQSTHSLPSGRFRYCCIIKPNSVAETGDDYCEEIESELSNYLFLINPSDKDTLDTKDPLFIWNHNEPFNLMPPGEYYKMVVVELQNEQTAENAVSSFNPVFMQNNLLSHQVQYPYDAKKLENGKRYGWQIQRINNGVITNRSDAWEFVVSDKLPVKENKYALLNKIPDGSYYYALNNHIFFYYDDPYDSNSLQCRIFNAQNEAVKTEIQVDNYNQDNIKAESEGKNIFKINLNGLGLKSGIYILEVRNVKNELQYLKFYIP